MSDHASDGGNPEPKKVMDAIPSNLGEYPPSEGVFLLDAQWRFTYVSPGTAEILSSDPLEGRIFWDVFTTTPEAGAPATVIAGQERSAKAVEDSIGVKAKWVSAHAWPYPGGLIVSLRDLSHKQRGDEDLRENEYRDLVENAGLMIGTHTLDGKILSANQSAVRFCGVRRESDLVGRAIVEFLTPEVRPLFDTYLNEIRTRGRAHGIMKIASRDGRPYFIEYDNSLRTNGPRPVVRSIGRDVTEKIRTGIALARSEAQFRSLSASSPIGIFHTDDQGLCTYTNWRFQEIFGLPAEECLGNKWSQAIHPDDRDGILSTWMEAARQGRECNLEFRLLKPSGEVRFVRARKKAVLDDSGQLLGYVGTEEDITERRQAANLLALQAKVLKRIAVGQELPEVFRDISSMVEGQLSGVTCTIVVEDESPDEVETDERSAPIHSQTGVILGRLFLRDQAGKLVPTEDSETVRIAAHLAGIAIERKEAEKLLIEQATLLNHAREAIVVTDPGGRIRYWNPGAEHIYGWSAEEAIGADVTTMLGGCAAAANAYQETIEAGDFAGEVSQRTKGGSEIIVESHVTAIRGADGVHKLTLIINDDVTEKKRLEAQYLRAQRMESIGALASGIAHDLNNLLSPMMMVEHILELKHTDNHSQQLLDTLRSSIQRASDLVNQVVSFAKGTLGERVTINPRYLLKEIEKLFAETFPRSIHLELEESQHLWLTEGDITQLYQVLINLCVNARDAMPRGGRLTLKAENIDLSPEQASQLPDGVPGKHVCLTVADNGTGISEQDKTRIFDLFFTTKESNHGGGLGLATVRHIVSAHRGFIAVESELGMGTEFKVFLPAVFDVQPNLSDAVGTLMPIGSGELILVIDSEAAIREVTRETLGMYGYDVITASDASEAMSLYLGRAAELRAILLDGSLRSPDARSLIGAIKQRTPACAVIATSDVSQNDAALDQLDLAATLAKPFSAEKLLRTLAHVVV